MFKDLIKKVKAHNHVAYVIANLCAFQPRKLYLNSYPSVRLSEHMSLTLADVPLCAFHGHARAPLLLLLLRRD